MTLTMIVEMPQNSTLKYELNKATNRLKLDRPLNQPVPYSYGFVENTLEGDGDPIDIFSGIVSDRSGPELLDKFYYLLLCIYG